MLFFRVKKKFPIDIPLENSSIFYQFWYQSPLFCINSFLSNKCIWQLKLTLLKEGVHGSHSLSQIKKIKQKWDEFVIDATSVWFLAQLSHSVALLIWIFVDAFFFFNFIFYIILKLHYQPLNLITFFLFQILNFKFF